MRPATAFLGSLTSRKPSSGYVCPNCIVRHALRRARQRQASTHRFQPWARRHVSTISSVTAVNVKKDLPPAFRGLYDALGVLQREAAVYANLSQIQLALRGLESENGITRIAALGGVDGHQTRRLVRVLLADPLTPEPEWEKQLSGLDDSDGRALLLRYAERFDVDQRHPLVRTLFVPSPVLQNHRLEILIQAANEQSEDGNGEAQMYLVSGLESPTSSAGSYQTITYPVHKALVLAQRLKSTRALLSPRLGSEAGAGEDMILAVVNTPWSSLSPAFEPLNPIKVINLDRAEEAIATFRKSLDNSFHYEHEWFDSGLPQLSTWLIEGTESLPGMVKPTIRRLIETLVANVEEAIQKEEASVMKVQASSVVPQATRDKMNAYLANWAEAAHIELRDKLDRAFSSKQWRKLAWWKLLWRVDDVTSITSDILQRSWLVDADRGILYLAGRIEEAGLLPPSPISTPPSSTDTDASVSYSIENSQGSNPYAQPLPEPDRPDPSTRRFGSPPPNTHLIDLLPLTHPASLLTDHTIPSIAHARNHLLRTTLPPLQSLAQRLLLSSLSLTALTSTLSALVYIATTSTTMFEAGAIAATGAVVAARRLQRGWERGRESWEERVREEGKVVLGGVEGRWREVVGEAGMEAGEGGTKGEGEEERQRARVAVGGVRRELEAMEKN